MYSKEKDATPQKYLNTQVPFTSVQVRQLHIFGPKCLLLNNVVITIQSILGSVVLVKFLVGGDLKFCSRHAYVCNTTDIKQNKFIHNRYSTGQNIYMLQNKKNQHKTKQKIHYFAEDIATFSYTSPLGAQTKRLHVQPREPGDRTWKSYCRLSRRSTKASEIHSMNIKYRNKLLHGIYSMLWHCSL